MQLSYKIFHHLCVQIFWANQILSYLLIQHKFSIWIMLTGVIILIFALFVLMVFAKILFHFIMHNGCQFSCSLSQTLNHHSQFTYNLMRITGSSMNRFRRFYCNNLLQFSQRILHSRNRKECSSTTKITCQTSTPEAVAVITATITSCL